MNLYRSGLLAVAAIALAPHQSSAANLIMSVSFNGTDGVSPYLTGLIADANRDLFGTTYQGGAHGFGTVFEIANTAAGYASTPTVLYSFCAQANCADGANPTGGLIADADGNLLGTTQQGGTYYLPGGGYFGTVFEIAKIASGFASTPTTLVNFNGTDGGFPWARLLPDANGNFFGTTGGGGNLMTCFGGCGTVFEITKTASGYASTALVSFCTLAGCADGVTPIAGLIADADGNLLGTTDLGGTSRLGGIGPGTVFEIAKTASGYASTPTTLVNFDVTNTAASSAGLIADANGNLFGTASGGGYGGYRNRRGTVFEIAKTAAGYASAPTILYSFCAQANCTDGDYPEAGLIADANGNLFGTTFFGGAHGGGTVFEIAKTAAGYASAPTILYSFCAQANCTDGSNPSAGLIADADGNLFGMTQEEGTFGYGTVFEINSSGFVAFIGTPGNRNCYGQSVSALAKQYGILDAAAPAFGYSNVWDLQNAIMAYCAG